MATRPSEETAGQGRGDLIREMGRGISYPVTPATSEQDLMRLAADPLLIREFIWRHEPAGPVARTVLPLPGETTLALASTASACGGARAVGRFSRAAQYERKISGCESSVFPSAFRPSLEDRRKALDHADQSEARAARAQGGLALFAAMLAVAVSLLLLLAWS